MENLFEDAKMCVGNTIRTGRSKRQLLARIPTKDTRKRHKMVPNCVKEEAAGVGIVTKQNATKDVPVGGEYMNVKKLGLGKGKPKTMREEWEEFKENFADGKKKGKSRPGRVKRAGASCKGSVTSLRAKPKRHQVNVQRCITGVPT